MGASFQPYRHYDVLQASNPKQAEEEKTPNKTALLFTALVQSQG